MAQMYPAGIERLEKATEGEKRVFRFLRDGAKPDRDFIGWYEPSIGSEGKEPDFVLFAKNLGLLVLEVKDWTLPQIKGYTPLEFTLFRSGKMEKKTNPDKQAKGYVIALMEHLKAVAELQSHLPFKEGGLKIPIGRMVAFTNIRREEYFAKGLQWMIPVERALFEEDLAPGGEILRDPSGKKLVDRISGSFPFRFLGLRPKEFEKLTLAVWPESRIKLPLREGPEKWGFRQEVEALDEAQARLALRLGSGHRIIEGPPGTGKTLVLVHRCCHLYRFQRTAKRILLVCYNIALVSYLRRLLQEKGVGVGGEGVQVLHFFELCSRILGETIHYENEDSEYYDVVLQEARKRMMEGKSLVAPYDAILVDEGQDFSCDMVRVLLSLLRPGGDLIIALDAFQDLYRRKESWRRSGIRAGGRVHRLRRTYRNTAEITDFARRFIGERPEPTVQISIDTTFHGDPPALCRFNSHEEIENFLVKDLMECLGEGEYRRSEIAIIYDDKSYTPERFSYDNRALPMRILKKLEGSGIPSIWVSQDVRSKEMFDVTTDRVSLISVHSSKGLDFDLVYLLGMDHIHPTDQTRENLVTLVYVAMTRAKYKLVIPYVEETEFIRHMKKSQESHRAG